MKILAEDMHDLMDVVFAGGVALKLSSEPGAGKSKQAESYAAIKNRMWQDDGGYGCFVYDMSTGNVADFIGYLMPQTVTDTDVNGMSQEVLAAKYTYPNWAYDITTKKPLYKFKRGLIILEEWGQADPELKRACAPLINDGRVWLWRFEGFDILILSNRDIDRSGVTREYDFLINRWCEAELKATLNGFLVAGAQLGMTPLTLAFASRNTDMLFQAAVPEKQGSWLTQRSLHKFDNIIRANAARGVTLESDLMKVAAEGLLGKAAASAYLTFAVARTKVPTVASIVADPAGAPIPHELDVLMFLVFDLASKTTRANIGPIFTYVKRMSSAMQVTYFESASRRDDDLVMTSEFTDFAISNLTLISAAAARRVKK
jgi:hypothetical protein